MASHATAPTAIRAACLHPPSFAICCVPLDFVCLFPFAKPLHPGLLSVLIDWRGHCLRCRDAHTAAHVTLSLTQTRRQLPIDPEFLHSWTQLLPYTPSLPHYPSDLSSLPLPAPQALGQ